MESFSNTQWSAWGMPPTEDSLPGYSMPDYPSYLAESMEAAYHNHQQHLAHHQQITRITESKPRLSKEEVQVLETEFLKNHKPNTIVKKAIAESMRVDNARINVSRFSSSHILPLTNLLFLELVPEQTC